MGQRAYGWPRRDFYVKRRREAYQQVDMPSLAVRLGLDSSVRALAENPLVIAGAEGSTVRRFLGSQAAAAGWSEYGGAGTLAETGAGTSPTYSANAPYLGASDGMVLFNGTGAAGASGRSFVGTATDIFTTEDLLLELVVLRNSPSSAGILIGKYQAAGAAGWVCYADATSIVALLATGAAPTSFSVAVATGAVAHILIAVNRDENSTDGAVAYANAVAGSGANLIARVGSVGNANKFCIGGYEAQAYAANSGILYAAVHARAAWHQAGAAGPAEWLAVAKARTALLFASRPAFSVVPSTYPSSAGSTSPVYQTRRLSDGTDRLHYMGAGSPCFDRVVDVAGRAVVAHLVEVAEAQSCAVVTALAGTEQSSTQTANAAVAPDGNTTMTRLVEKASAAVHHGRYFSGASFSVDDTIAISGYVLAGDRCAGYGTMHGNGPGCLIIVNPATGETGFATDAESYHALVAGSLGSRSLGGGMWRVWGKVQVKFAGTQYSLFGLASGTAGSTANTYVGDATSYPLGACFWGMQVGNANAAFAYPSSLIATAATRAASVCKYAATNCFPRAEGTVIGAVLARSFTPTRARVLFSISDGSVDNEVQIFTTATTGLLSASSRKAAGTSGDVVLTASGSVYTNAIIPVMVAWRQGELALWARISGVWVRAQDLTIDAVAGATFTTFAAGSDGAGANQCGPGAYWLAGWQAFPQFFSDPTAVRSGVDSLWSSL